MMAEFAESGEFQEYFFHKRILEFADKYLDNPARQTVWERIQKAFGKKTDFMAEVKNCIMKK